jgi:uncharacterized RDD family membrane protein YckC
MICKRCGATNQEKTLRCLNCQAPLEAEVSLDDLIGGSSVISRHLIDPDATSLPTPPRPSPPNPTDSVKEIVFSSVEIPEKPIVAASVAPPPVSLEPEPPNLRSGYLNYRRLDTNLLVLAKFATLRQRIGAAVYDNALLATIIAFPGAIVVLILASQSRFILLPYRDMLEDIANSFVRPVTVGFVLLFTLISFPYYLILTMLGGQTSGKRYIGIRVVTVDGSSPSLAIAFFRTLYGLPINLAFCAAVYFNHFEIAFLSLPFLIGLVVALFMPTRQGLHDMLAHTYVVSNKEMVEDIDF